MHLRRWLESQTDASHSRVNLVSSTLEELGDRNRDGCRDHSGCCPFHSSTGGDGRGKGEWSLVVATKLMAAATATAITATWDEAIPLGRQGLNVEERMGGMSPSSHTFKAKLEFDGISSKKQEPLPPSNPDS
ncbi:hypothetical protein ONZ45_g15584 [Pleurotus djamor]|nr:hypothetical protein ONZ45_g15584 [Pleurotus djamor]